jgi:hypothetical protein
MYLNLSRLCKPSGQRAGSTACADRPFRDARRPLAGILGVGLGGGYGRRARGEHACSGRNAGARPVTAKCAGGPGKEHRREPVLRMPCLRDPYAVPPGSHQQPKPACERHRGPRARII